MTTNLIFCILVENMKFLSKSFMKDLRTLHKSKSTLQYVFACIQASFMQVKLHLWQILKSLLQQSRAKKLHNYGGLQGFSPMHGKNSSVIPKMFNLKHNNVIVQVDNLEAIINSSEKVFIEKFSTCTCHIIIILKMTFYFLQIM